ncbi:MAG: glycosyltransferase family 4 protein [Candidatus Moraniibacteriota bacterium]|nr:MAG: glycosyltransferase family 4 protein [Candidatus Moranbacteria bacterium]
MKIGLDIRNVGKNRTGDETVFFHLAKYLPLVSEEDSFRFLLDDRTEEEIKILENRLGVKAFRDTSLYQCGNGNKFLWNAFSAQNAARKLDLDIYHTQYILPWGIPKKTKMITHIHDISFARYPEYLSYKDRFFLQTLIPKSIERSSAIIAVSEFTKEELIHYYRIKSEKIFVIPNAVEDVYGQDISTNFQKEEVKKKYILPKKFIFHIGTLQPRKNIPFLLVAFSQLLKKIPDVALVFTGSKKSYHFDTSIEETIIKYKLQKSVLFLGYIPEEDLKIIMDLSDTIVSVSLYEGFGLPLLEAMARNIPLVVSDIPPYREVAENAALFVPFKKEILTESLYRVIIDKHFSQSLREKGSERKKLFNWKKSAQMLAEVYHKM